MNNPTNPFVPQGSMLEQKIKSRARFKTAFFCVLAVNLVPITIALLMQGCQKQDDTNKEATTAATSLDNSNAFPSDVTSTQLVTGVPPPAHENTPAAAPTTTEYIVKSGDNLTTIARNFHGVTVKQIQDANPGLDPRKLQIGQKLQIPAPLAPTTSAAGSTVDPNATGEQTYTVKSGDTLSKIATDHGTTVRAIRAANNLTTDRIVVGQVLKLPPRTVPPAAPAPPGTTPPPKPQM